MLSRTHTHANPSWRDHVPLPSATSKRHFQAPPSVCPTQTESALLCVPPRSSLQKAGADKLPKMPRRGNFLGARCRSVQLWSLASLLSATAFSPPRQFSLRQVAPTSTFLQALSSSDYLASMEASPAARNPAERAPARVPRAAETSELRFEHASLTFFSIDKLSPKGPRKNPDVGQPHDATRPLGKLGPVSAGSWWCYDGGWPSPTQRTTTEIFHVFSGHGCVTDLDGMKHFFGPGDTVILPKGWSGRWDVLEAIHKVWFVHDHANIEERSNPIRAVITPYHQSAPQHLVPSGVRGDATHGSPATASQTLYDVGPQEVGFWTCTPGSFPVVSRKTTECFHVLEGVFFLTNADGTARRCVAGDTVMLPKGWSGHWDVIEPVKKLWLLV
eukprot:scaffold429_cov269-Pinguiococcus_pyrenoidosus.AAC.6